MSTNPRTKAYRRRVRRMARELFFRHPQISLYEAARSCDPTATDQMVEDALEHAIRDRREFAEMSARSAERYLQEAERLEALRDQTRRARLTIIDGGAA